MTYIQVESLQEGEALKKETREKTSYACPPEQYPKT
jgi:hypothetical protein